MQIPSFQSIPSSKITSFLYPTFFHRIFHVILQILKKKISAAMNGNTFIHRPLNSNIWIIKSDPRICFFVIFAIALIEHYRTIFQAGKPMRETARNIKTQMIINAKFMSNPLFKCRTISPQVNDYIPYCSCSTTD